MKKFTIIYKIPLSILGVVLLSWQPMLVRAQDSELPASGSSYDSSTSPRYEGSAIGLRALAASRTTPVRQGSHLQAFAAPRPAAPDLVVAAAPQLSATLLPAGDAVVVKTTVRNAGTTRAGFSVLGYYLSADATLSNDDVLLGEAVTAALAPGDSLAISAPATVPTGTATGAHYLLCVADYLNLVRESNDGNNVRGYQLGVVSPRVAAALPNQLTPQLASNNHNAASQAQELAGAGLSASPNPVAHATPLRVQLRAAKALAAATLALYNSQGQQVAAQALGLAPDCTTQVEFSTAGLAAGVYVLRLSGSDLHATCRVIIE